MGYQPPFINLNKLKERLPGRIDYYRVVLYISVKGDLLIAFTKDDYCHIIECKRKEK